MISFLATLPPWPKLASFDAFVSRAVRIDPVSTEAASRSSGPVYLDCNASTPLAPDVLEVMNAHFRTNPANAAAQTHRLGQQARQTIELARARVADLVGARRAEIIFTSGATEANNLALLGAVQIHPLPAKKHIITTSIEHPAVLEPLAHLEELGFEVELIAPKSTGVVDAGAIIDALRSDTTLVSIMHVNNVLGTVQPIGAIADALADHDALFHVDAAQGAAHRPADLSHPRIDLVSLSGHKMYGPKGVGALVYRLRAQRVRPLSARTFGGAQELGLRPGTTPAGLVAGFGEAARLCRKRSEQRAEQNRAFGRALVEGLAPLQPIYHGDESRRICHVACLSFPGVRARAAMLRLRDLVAISTGSACTSHTGEPSPSLTALSLPQDLLRGALRFSWYHDSPPVDWDVVVDRLRPLVR